MAKKNNNSSKTSSGCLMVILALFVIAIALVIYSYAWIPGIIAIIYFTLKKDLEKNAKIKRIAIASAIVVTSLITFGSMNSKPELTGLQIKLSQKDFDINDTAEVSLTLTPSTAKIDTLIISDNDIAELEYNDGKATISFKAEGEATISFTANESIESNSITVTVIDKEAEAQRLKKEEERLAAEEEARKQAEEEAKKQAEEEAKRQAEEEAKRKAEEEAQKQAELETQQQTEVTTQQEEISSEDNSNNSSSETTSNSSTMVWVDDTAKRYHNKNGCGMDNAYQVTLEEAEAMGKTPCGRCY